MLSGEFHEFHREWLGKANQYDGHDLHSLFDKFFTLFVVYNRLYAETTFVLARRNPKILSTRSTFPDSKAATSYVLQYLRATDYINGLRDAPACQASIERIIDLIDREVFAVKLDMIYGKPQRGKDLELRQRLRSGSAADQGHAILDVLYSIRCNLFHGHKDFVPVQAELLRPTIILLGKTIDLLYAKLSVELD